MCSIKEAGTQVVECTYIQSYGSDYDSDSNSHQDIEENIQHQQVDIVPEIQPKDITLNEDQSELPITIVVKEVKNKTKIPCILTQ